MPKLIKITPPTSSAFWPNFVPKGLFWLSKFPSFKPKAQSKKVIRPIIRIAWYIFSPRNSTKPKLTPTAKASMLVASASASICLKWSCALVFLQLSFSKLSLIIFAPTNANKTKAIQWSISFIKFVKLSTTK